MRTYSIYQKPCPACGAVVSIETRSCDCGYAFESQKADQQPVEELALQEEELFQAYLTARIDQAVEAVEAARSVFAAEPSNQRHTSKLIQAVQEALALREECEAQARKIAQLRESLPARPEAPSLSTQPTEAFRAQQAVRAEKIMESFGDTRTRACPHCKTVLPVTSALCLCGYIYARNDFMLPRAVDNSTRGEIYRPKE
ncbi:MAG: hypothetical protein OEY27_07375 [Gammaproteobacteria bacterium]|nr:hypothetical protein [Gammaproteobacteria bacterium]